MKHIYILSLFIILSACSSKKQEDPATPKPGVANLVTLTAAQLASSKIETGKVEEKSISAIIKVSGKIDVPPQNMISVSMPLGGFLRSTKLLPGMHISKGEVIGVMEDQQYIQLQQDYLTTKSKLAYLEAEFLRQKELNQSKATSDKIFQQTQMDYQTQKINLGAIAEKLKLIHVNPQQVSENNISRSVNIYSPITGFVSSVKVNTGKYVNPSDILFELVNPDDIHLNLQVFEKDLTKLAIGQKLLAYTNNNPEKKHPCEISIISHDLSPERTADVHCHFEDYDKTLVPGTYMNAEIKLKSQQSPALSEEAIIAYEGVNYVFIQKAPNQFQMTAIETGTKENGFIEIMNSTSFAGKNIVTKGAYTLLMALKNKPQE
ncbi:MAG: efflux RND transporter periplasmic adaptor subunit [Bacteroidetes bacterium]|nr:efflux RND transporter periplasmic adaptor subunit [Bacteroidota bacterium]